MTLTFGMLKYKRIDYTIKIYLSVFIVFMLFANHCNLLQRQARTSKPKQSQTVMTL